MSLTNQTISNGIWQTCTIAFRTVTQLIAVAVFARVLDPVDFGHMAIANTVIGFIGIFTQMGISQALVQKENLNEKHVRVAFSLIILVAITSVSLLYYLAPITAQFFNNPDVTVAIRALSISFFLTNLGLVAEALLIRQLAFKKLLTATALAYSVGYLLVGIGLAVSGFGIWALISATLVTHLTESLLYIALQPHPKCFKFAKKELRELMQFGGGITLLSLFKYVGNNADYFIIGRMLGPAALGVYQQAFNLFLLFTRLVGDVLERVLFASASRIQQHQARMSRSYSRSIGLINLCLLPLSIIMIILTPEIIQIYLGEKWLDSILPAQILLVGLTFRSQSRISDAFIHAMGTVYRSAIRKGPFAVLVLFGSWFGLQWGIPGVATAITIVMIVDYLLVLELALRTTATSWEEHVDSLLPGIKLGALAFVVCQPCTILFRSLFDTHVYVLACSGLMSILLLLLFTVLFPATVGSRGIWFITMVLAYLPGHKWTDKYRTIWIERCNKWQNPKRA
jgi:O-antigen/teichoic acid export membrane protein